MKIRFIMSLAAMLLSISAFAQNGETLKGDVNGDGKIDVEDVTSVVDIILSGKAYGYFYFGTTEPTAENFTSLPGAVASYTSIGEAVGATVSVDNGETLYMLCPAAWMKGKHVEVEDGEGNSFDFVEDTDAGSISGYVIYKTQAFNEATDAILRFNKPSAETYYWYLGTQKFTTDAEIEANGIPINNSSDIPNPFTLNEPTGEYFVYLYYPKEFGTATMTDSGLPVGGKAVEELSNMNLTNYTGWRFPKGNNGAEVNISF